MEFYESVEFWMVNMVYIWLERMQPLIEMLTHWGLVMLYGDIDLSQHWLR